MDAEIHVTCLEIDNTPTCGKIVLRAKVLSLEAHPMNSEQEEHFQDFYDFRENLKAEACTLMLLRERTSYKDVLFDFKKIEQWLLSACWSI
ncbi:hypothetical protein BPOR_0120g00040 [Botrytis porri]|uniref:Uncharacterized protein n=1 Tax=Botrytis porri TaxID=87229 RepID=A0A4Z1KXK8_9HELO|nr:hypothetical protein BPOR_0120g00040 [Botrytis porri]